MNALALYLHCLPDGRILVYFFLSPNMVHPIWIGVCQRFWHLVFFLGPNLPLRCPFLQLFCLSIFWFVAGICYGSLMLVAYQALKELLLPKVALLSSCLVTWGFDVWALEGFRSIEESKWCELSCLGLGGVVRLYNFWQFIYPLALFRLNMHFIDAWEDYPICSFDCPIWL